MAIGSLALSDSMNAATSFAVSINGQDFRILPEALVEYLQANMTFPSALESQYSAPSATGFSVTIEQANTHLILTPTAGFAAGTVVLPTVVEDGDEVLVNCTQSLAALTITGTAVGAPASLAANGFFRLKYDAVSGNWYRVG